MDNIGLFRRISACLAETYKIRPFLPLNQLWKCHRSIIGSRLSLLFPRQDYLEHYEKAYSRKARNTVVDYDGYDDFHGNIINEWNPRMS